MNTISLLSLNTFGVPFFLGWRRLARLAKTLNRLDADVICLQEIQQNAYIPLVASGLRDYPDHACERHVYAPKGGLMTFSRLPIQNQVFAPYQDRGRWWSLGFADWALYKGVLIAQVQVGAQKVRVLNTHLHANYVGSWVAENSLTRVQLKQVKEIASLVRSQPRDALVILCGDLNFPRHSFLYQELMSYGDLLDPLAEDDRPTYKPFPLVPSRWSMPLDYLLVRLPPDQDVRLSADIQPIEYRQARWPHQRFLTDHHALTLQVDWIKAGIQAAPAVLSEEVV
jgi:endonuclease/exonuclease/phosphatase family metal-dependent hydrolase